MKAFLLSGQEDALILTSRAVATVLHDRPELFAEDTELSNENEEENEIFAAPLPNYININGELSDWGEQAKRAIEHRVDLSSSKPEAEQAQINNSDPSDTQTTELKTDLAEVSAEDFSVWHTLGYHGRFIYGLFRVLDDNVLYRRDEHLRVDSADHIRLILQNPNLPPTRYTLISGAAGRMSAYLMDAQWQYPVTGQPNYTIAAELAETEQGYNIELRIPRFLLSSETRISMQVVDVDDWEQPGNASIIATTPQSETDELSKLLVQSPEIAKILSGLERADTRIWVLDNQKRVRTVVGNIVTEAPERLAKPFLPPKSFDEAWYTAAYYYHKILGWIFNIIIEQPAATFTDHEKTVEQRNDEIIDQALSGKTAIDRRPSTDGQGTILMSTNPVFLGDSVLGAVIVEQSTNQVLKNQQDVLQNVISVTLIVLLTVGLSILLFASRLTYRISRLSNSADNAIDPDGRIVSQRIRSDAKSGDEIGDLSRSISNMLARLSQYTSYLKGLPDTLSHEVSNPLNVVNSSLHNLAEDVPEVANSRYLDRAMNGVNRIRLILRNLTEAANLEQAMQKEHREVFDLVELVSNYVDGYQFSHAEQEFKLHVLSRPLSVHATPDYIAQLLDKLIDNALDFAESDTPIVVRLRKVDGFAEIDVINQGSYLPDNMSERIFEPLVSLGRKDA
jgi:dedicated sortase system histidine kinase